jgi:hypothetical protein
MKAVSKQNTGHMTLVTGREIEDISVQILNLTTVKLYKKKEIKSITAPLYFRRGTYVIQQECS